MCCTFAVTFITRFVWTPLNATVSEELGLTAVQAGAFMSAFFVGYVITQIPGGYLADRIGVKWVLSAGILLSGVASLGMAYITSYGSGFVLRVITGLGGGVFMACATKVIADNFPNLKERGIAFGILQVGATVRSWASSWSRRPCTVSSTPSPTISSPISSSSWKTSTPTPSSPTTTGAPRPPSSSPRRFGRNFSRSPTGSSTGI